MNDPIADAAERAAGHHAPPKVWHAGLDAAVEFGTGRNPFDGATFTHWTRE